MRITETMSREAYLVAQDVYLGKIKKVDGVADLTDRLGMNSGSAADLVTNLRHMLDGSEYHRTLNIFTTTLYLENIRDDFGEPALRNALLALELHLDYYDALGSGRHVQLRELFDEYQAELDDSLGHPDEINPGDELIEGAKKKVLVNSYERSKIARSKCLGEYGYQCSVCDLDFENMYGEIGREYIHVHHLIELSSIGSEYTIDPLQDLRPVCPNCHVMLHKRKPAFSIEELKAIVSATVK